jgi:hypothetical protein
VLVAVSLVPMARAPLVPSTEAQRRATGDATMQTARAVRGVFAANVGLVYARATPVQKCSVAKTKVPVKKISAN